MMKRTRGKKPKAANEDPNYSDQERRETVPIPPSVPKTTNCYGSTLQHFVTIENHHLRRLHYLFPEINPAALRRILDLFAGDFIRAVDHILCIRRNDFMYGSHENNPSSAGFYGNRRALSHPYMYKHVSSNNNNMTMVEPPFMIPIFQTSHKIPYINQTTPSNYHIYQHPGMNNNSMLMQTPVFVHGYNIGTPNQFFQKSNKLPELVPCSTLPKCRPSALPVRTSTCQPFTEEFKPMLRPPFSYSDMPQLYSYESNGNASNVHGQYLMEPSQMVRPNLAPAIKQMTEWTDPAACNSCERPSNRTNQVTNRTMTEIYAKELKESCFQQQQQQGDENQMMDFLNNIEPQISHQSHQDADETSVPLMHLPASHGREITPINILSTAADVQYQRGKFEDNLFKSSAANDDELVTVVDMTQKFVTEEMQMLRVTSDANVNKSAAEGSVPLQEENEQRSFAGRKNSYYSTFIPHH